jgi:hypothetical protein
MLRLQERENRFQLDPIGECYFAALIYGLRIINEKEADRGMVPGSTPLDVDALVHFVRRKGDVLVHHMSLETGVRWTREEVELVATECARLFPGETKFTTEHAFQAQQILPEDRRKSEKQFFRPLLLKLGGVQLPKRRAAGSARLPLVARNGHQDISALPPTIGLPDSLIDVLSEQVVAGLLAFNVKVLEAAAERLRAQQSSASPARTCKSAT